MIPGDDEVRVEIDAAVMTITLNRPKANAIDLATSRKLGEAFVYFRDNPDLKVAIITGAGEKIFCAGWDLKALDSGDVGALRGMIQDRVDGYHQPSFEPRSEQS